MLAGAIGKRLQLLALVASAAAVVLIAVISWPHPGAVVSTQEAERKLTRAARRERVPLRHVECTRSEERLPRSFLCFGEGAFDTHVVYRVIVRRDGKVSFRPSY